MTDLYDHRTRQELGDEILQARTKLILEQVKGVLQSLAAGPDTVRCLIND